jgi:heat shock protein HslJ
MKKLSVCFGVAILLLTAACKKSSESNSFTGFWKLTEELNDPGDGSGQWRATNNTSANIDFHADSSYSTNVGIINSFDKYSVSGDNITFYKAGTTNKITYKFSLNDKQLDIYPLCIERCGLRFRKD